MLQWPLEFLELWPLFLTQCDHDFVAANDGRRPFGDDRLQVVKRYVVFGASCVRANRHASLLAMLRAERCVLVPFGDQAPGYDVAIDGGE